MPADHLAQLNQRQYRFITEYVFGEHFGNAKFIDSISRMA